MPPPLCISSLALTGDLYSSFAELGSAIPVNGGAQAYLAYAYHPIVSFLYVRLPIRLLNLFLIPS